MSALEWRDLELGRKLRSGTASAVHEARSGGQGLLVTLSAAHEPPAARSTYELTFPGIAPLVWVGRPDGVTFGDALVEALPAGTAPAANLPERALAALGARLAEVVVPVHDAGVVLDGIQPALIYLDSAQTFATLAPRGPRFIATARKGASGIGAYGIPYLGHECLALGKPPGPASDVFALCASLFVLATGRHPFGALDNLGEIMQRTLMDAREPLPGALGDVLASGLAPDPAARPTMRELSDLLRR